MPSCFFFFFFLMIRRPPRSTQSRSSAASDVYKRQGRGRSERRGLMDLHCGYREAERLSLIHISEPTRLGMISYAVFCLKKKKYTQPKIDALQTKEHNKKKDEQKKRT